jgi:DNA-binding winged helix-turn-helix (wHTH) protein
MITRGLPDGTNRLVPARYYIFGPFCLDTQNRSLSRGGGLLRLQPRAYEVLLKLVQNANRLVTRDELLNSVWGTDVNVEEGALRYQISQLRSALGDAASKPEYIKTIPKHGFQFVASVRAHSKSEQASEKVCEDQGQYVAAGVIEHKRGFDMDGDPHALLLRLLQSRFCGHEWYALGASVLYAAYFGVALLVEIAYEFDRYDSVKWTAPLISCFIFISSLLGLSVGARRASSGKRAGLLLCALIFVFAAGLTLIIACTFLPEEPITQANFQTFTAQAAYIKDLCYIAPLGLIFLVTPLHFVVAIERELSSNEPLLAANLLTGTVPNAPPIGTLFLRIWFLLLLLIGMIAYSLIARSHLFDNLKPSPYMNLFQSLIHVRMILYFGLAILCVTWYYRVLNELRRDSVAGRTIAEHHTQVS